VLAIHYLHAITTAVSAAGLAIAVTAIFVAFKPYGLMAVAIGYPRQILSSSSRFGTTPNGKPERTARYSLQVP